MGFWSDLLAAAWGLFREASFYMLLGFLVAALVHAWVRTETVVRHLGTGRFRPVFLAALVGIPLPLCSCGVVPAAAGLRRKGASDGATMAFLISTPESGVDSIAVTYALLDPLMAVVRPVAAFLTAFTAGIAQALLPERVALPTPLPAATGCGCDGGCGPVPPAGKSDSPSGSRLSRLGAGLRYAFGDLLGDIGRWFLLGILLAALITVLVPDGWIGALSAAPLASMGLMLAAGIPMYVCATASTPIAAALILKGLNPGAALVFLLAGPATNMATISMVTGLLGRRALAVYLTAIAACSLALGLLTDALYALLGTEARAVAGEAAHFLPPGLEIAAAVCFAALLAAATLRPLIRRRGPTGGGCSQGACG